jgi:hypothetical protein
MRKKIYIICNIIFALMILFHIFAFYTWLYWDKCIIRDYEALITLGFQSLISLVILITKDKQ